MAKVIIGASMIRMGFWGYRSIIIKGPEGNNISNYSDPPCFSRFRAQLPHAAVMP